MEKTFVIPPWAVLIAMFVGACVVAEIGYRLGARRRERGQAAVPAGATTMVGSILALLAFFLAFTFGMAAARFDSRRSLIIEEANAVTTAYQRADLLPEPWAGRLREGLREYVALRLAGVAAPTLEATADTIRRSEELHGMLWTQAIQATESRPAPTNSLVLQALNELFDVHADRVGGALYGGIPKMIWLVLLLVTIAAMMAVGYQAGLAGPRPSLVAFLLMFAVSAVIALIVDLNSPLVGLVEASQQALQDAARVLDAGPQ